MKYMGSKTRLAKSLVSIIQRYVDESEFNTYSVNFDSNRRIKQERIEKLFILP